MQNFYQVPRFLHIGETETERDRERQRDRETERDRERELFCNI